MLAQSFVKPRNFENIIGFAGTPKSGLVFAARGTGKTACRVMIDYYCKGGEAPIGLDEDGNLVLGYALSVPHVNFLEVFQISENHSRTNSDKSLPSAFHHVEEIMRRAIPALANLLDNEIFLRRKIQDLDQLQKYELIWISFRYGNYLTPLQASLLSDLGIYTKIETSPSFRGLIDNSKNPKKVPEWFDAWLQTRSSNSSIEDLMRLAAIINGIGIVATYILVDGLDEIEQTVDNPADAYKFIRSLLTNMRLIDGIPFLAVKIFFPL